MIKIKIPETSVISLDSNHIRWRQKYRAEKLCHETAKESLPARRVVLCIAPFSLRGDPREISPWIQA